MMNNYRKKRIVDKVSSRLLSIAERANKRKKYELTLEALSAYCNIQYNVNQKYTDDVVENIVIDLSNKIINKDNFSSENNTVLFYDGFGLDLRGWAAAYVRAILRNGYKLVYVTNIEKKNNIPHIMNELRQGKSEAYFIDMSHGHIKWVRELEQVFNNSKPRTAFFYTVPNDIAAAVVFAAFDNVTRFQIDLTDHAFWIGAKSVDYCLESREMGASKAIYERKFDKNQIIKIDGCLYINKSRLDEPFPFNIEKEEYIFSGGSLYKTLGDDDLLFYKTISIILKHNPKIKYLYVGTGDAKELDKLKDIFPGRVFHIGERSDFYLLIKNCLFMWNTYPMFGGLMMRYAAYAGKIPLTLKHGDDHEGILFNQAERGIEFDTYEEVIEEADKLIKDNKYREVKEQMLIGAVISEEQFANNIKKIIEFQTSDYHFDDINPIDTTEFKKTYINRIDDIQGLLANCIVNSNNYLIMFRFPRLLIKRIVNKIRQRM